MTRIGKCLVTLLVVLHQVARRVDAETVDTDVQPEAQNVLMDGDACLMNHMQAFCNIP